MKVPACFAHEIKVDRNNARQLIEQGFEGEVQGEGTSLRVEGEGRAVRVIAGPSRLADGERALHARRQYREEPGRLSEAGAIRWIGALEPSAPPRTWSIP